MPCIIKLTDGGDTWYLIWSFVTHAPETFGLTFDELREHIREENGRVGLENLPPRLDRVERFGTSELGVESVDDTIAVNRAGPGERQATRAEIIEWYCRRKEDPR